MTPIPAPSPNQEPRPPGTRIDLLILHYTGMATGAEALTRLRDPTARVSAHYLIEEDGRILALVPEAQRAWHAGVAAWAGARDINDRSLGIELVNPGHDGGYRPFPEAQMAALESLAAAIAARHAIPPARVLGHSDVAPTRKRDPGELFDWPRLARAGLGLWPDPARPVPTEDASAAALHAALTRLGYDAEAPPDAVLLAFQRHFQPERLGRPGDRETLRRVLSLLEQLETGPRVG